MSDPLLNAGFTRQQVADALEFCDNDRERALGWLKKQKKGGGKLQWSEALTEKMKTMPDGQLKQTFEWMLSYDNVPIKPKTFKNFCKNSFNLQRNEALVEQMWTEFEPLVRKTPPAAKPAASAPAAVAAAPPASQDESATKKRSRTSEESDEKAAKKAKKAQKAEALAVLESLSREQVSALVAGIEAGVDLAEELKKVIAAGGGGGTEGGGEPKKQKKEKKKDKKEKKKKKKKEK